MDEQLPSGARRIADHFPSIWRAYAELGKACAEAGPLDAKTRRMVKLALSVGAWSQGAVHSHVRRGLREGISAAELKHVALLAVPTLGLPKAVAALTWIEDITGGEAPSEDASRRVAGGFTGDDSAQLRDA